MPRGVGATGDRALAAGTAAHPAVAVDVTEFIRGTTFLYPVLGSPIAQVKAPMLGRDCHG